MRSHHPDYMIAVIVSVLLAIGLVLMYSISPVLSHNLAGPYNPSYYFINQLKYVLFGVVVWIVVASINFSNWRIWSKYFIGVAILGMLALAVPGLSHSSNGATRWIGFGSFTVQPSEILKLALILYLAAWFENRSEDMKNFWDGIVPFGIMVGVACFWIAIFQRDMGTTMVIAATAVGMLYVAGVRGKHLAGVFAGGAVLVWALVLAFPNRLGRLTTFLNPRCSDPTYALNGSLQVCQALLGVGSGGILGVGLGHSIQVYGYLPESANDSIFSIIGEEFGLIGSLAVVVLFGLLVYKALTVAKNAPDGFSRLAASGIALWMLFQALINIGATLSIMPLTGVPLPFISYGGTSLVFSLFGIGILMNISKYTAREAGDADSRQRRGDSRSYFAGIGNQRRVKVAR
jgi:cell division protein FtsW